MSEGFRTGLPPADMPTGRPGASPPRLSRLTPEQILRAEALQAVTRSKPHMDPLDQLKLAARYARWLETGRDDLL